MPARTGNTWTAARWSPKSRAARRARPPKDIPWLKLTATSHRGKGMFADVVTVQRINTEGGQLEGSCSTVGTFNSVPYATDYVFLKK